MYFALFALMVLSTCIELGNVGGWLMMHPCYCRLDDAARWGAMWARAFGEFPPTIGTVGARVIVPVGTTCSKLAMHSITLHYMTACLNGIQETEYPLFDHEGRPDPPTRHFATGQ